MSDGGTIPEIKPPISPWQLFYGGAHRLRRRWYRKRADRLERPVLSVGNLHWGGTGKTPMTAAIAKYIRDGGRHPVILSRGYGRRTKGVRIVSTGEGPLLGPLAAGDEPVQLAGELPGVSIVVGEDRYAAGVHALERLPKTPDLFLLEDGFSHLRLARDLDLLTFPASDPFAGGRLWPGGRLREPLAAVNRAQAALLTGAEPPAGDQLADGLRRFGFQGPGFAAPTAVLPPRIERGETLPPGSRILLVTGIARAERVVSSIDGLDYQTMGTLHFPDHHPYPAESLRKIEQKMRESGADWVLTTAKDHVKLLGRLEAPLALLPIRSQPEPAFWDWLDSQLSRLW